MTDSNDGWRAEWLALQEQQEGYERSALLIKLAAVAAFIAMQAFAMALSGAAAVLLVLWFQEAILKTFQARLCERLLRVELRLREAPGADRAEAAPMQLHSEWQTARPRGAALLTEYLANACRPTVAFPYLVLLPLLALRA